MNACKASSHVIRTLKRRVITFFPYCVALVSLLVCVHVAAFLVKPVTYEEREHVIIDSLVTGKGTCFGVRVFWRGNIHRFIHANQPKRIDHVALCFIHGSGMWSE